MMNISEIRRTHSRCLSPIGLLFPVLILLLVICPPLCLEIGRGSAAAQNPGIVSFATVSAAGFKPFVAPGSIVAGFGSNLTIGGAIYQAADINQSTPEIDLPEILGDVSIQVNGTTARLLFASAGQINYVLPSELEAGTGQVTVRRGGQIIASGTIEIAESAPYIFTANSDGGVPAALIYRLKTDGTLLIEPVTDYVAAESRYILRPVDLGPEGERVFLVLFLTGVRRISAPNQTRILIGGSEYIPAAVVAQGTFVGLDQVNFEIPRFLSGRLAITFVALGYLASNVCEIEIAPPATSPPSITFMSRETDLLATEVVEVSGSGFSEETEVLIADRNRKRFNAQIMERSTTRLKVQVPFGAGTGDLIVKTARGEAGRSVRMRTSMSGIIQAVERRLDGSDRRIGIPNVTVRVRAPSAILMATTNNDGSFLIPDVPVSAALTFEVDGTSNSALPFPKEIRKMRIEAERDNQYPYYIELQAATGPNVPTTGGGQLPDAAIRVAAQSTPRANELAGQPGPVIFEPRGSTVRFPDGTSVSSLTVTVLETGRVPADLPPAQFSSTVVQLTPFGAQIVPGGKLTFPNTDSLPAGSTATLYRFDQTPNSVTIGQFVPAGQARVSPNGQQIETDANAVKESTYYFISIPRPVTTIYGSVTEENGTPARGALVQVRGQSIFALTDQNGAFVLPNVPMIGTTGFAIEVSLLRPDGTVDRTERTGVRPGAGGLTFISPAIVLPGQGRTRAPVILVPKSLTLEAGKSAEFSFLAYARVAGQSLQSVTVIGAAFASIANLGNDRYSLRLAPGANEVGNYTLIISAIDTQGLSTTETIALEIKAAPNNVPTANGQSVTTDEDIPLNITLTGSNGSQFRIVSQPQRGRLNGAPPNLVYTPNENFNGSDSFSFAVSNGTVESNPATVTIVVRPVNDKPRLDVAPTYATNIGQLLTVVINGFDVDAGQKLTLEASNLPSGATITQTTATSWILVWRPGFDQIGNYNLNLTLRDDGTPSLSDQRVVVLVVEAKWAPTPGPEGGRIGSFAFLGTTIYVGTKGGVYRSIDGGNSWSPINGGTGLANILVNAITTMGNAIFAGTDGAGVYRSIDGGNSWTLINNGLTNGRVTSIMVKGSTIYVGTDGGIFRSTDSGDSWTPVNNGLTNNRVTALAMSGETIFAGTAGAGVFRSTDGGNSWVQINNGLTNLNINALLVNGNRLYAGGGGIFIHRSTDGGNTWTRSGTTTGSPIYSLAASGNTVYAAGAGAYSTSNGGDTWSINLRVPATIIYAVAVNGETIFAGTDGGGIFSSVNAGSSWTKINSGLTSTTVLAMAASGNTIFAGMLADGVHRSTDGGDSWTKTSLPNIQVFALAFGGNTIYAGTSGGIYRSFDGGVTWAQVNNGVASNGGVFALVAQGNAIYAGTLCAGVYRSTNNGDSWALVNIGATSNCIYSLAAIGSAIYVGTGGGGVYRSTDSGGTWTRISISSTTAQVWALYASENALFAGTNGGGLFRTTDGGVIWTPSNNGITHPQVIALAGSEGTLFAGTYGSGAYRSNDGGNSWTQINNGLISTRLYDLAVTGRTLFAGTDGGGVFRLAESEAVWGESNVGLGNRFINALISRGNKFLNGTYLGGIFSSTDEGRTWAPANTGLPPAADVRVLVNRNAGVFAGVYDAGIYYSTDEGVSWVARSNGLTNLRVNALAGSGSTLLAGTEGGVFRSTDDGLNWSVANNGLTRQRVLSLLAFGNDLYAGTDLGLFRSLNGGDSWVAVNPALIRLPIVALGVAPTGNALLAGTSDGIIRSINSGDQWERVTAGLPESVTALTFFVSGMRIYAGTVYGFYVSEDQGASWRGINAGLLNLQVTGIAVQGKLVLVGTRSSGVFKTQLE